jgi:hypothetical protein
MLRKITCSLQKSSQKTRTSNCYLSEAMSAFDIIGSTGNSAILRPSWEREKQHNLFSCIPQNVLSIAYDNKQHHTFVNSPWWFNAPKAYNCSKAKIRVSAGGGSMKSKWIRSFIPRLFKSNTTFPRFVLWIWKIKVHQQGGKVGQVYSHPRPSSVPHPCCTLTPPQRTTYLGYGIFLQFILVCPSGVQSKTFPGGHAPSTSCSLIGRSLDRQ